jgi:SAM-dependent methyltransferase
MRGALMAGCNGNRTSNTIATGNESGTTGTAGNGVSANDRNWVNDQLATITAEVPAPREQRKAIARIASVLKPGGSFLFTAGDVDGEKEGDPMNGVAFHYWSFRIENYRDLLRANGLTLLDVHRDAGENSYYLARKQNPSYRQTAP